MSWFLLPSLLLHQVTVHYMQLNTVKTLDPEEEKNVSLF